MSSPSDSGTGRERMIAELTNTMLSLIGNPSGTKHFVVHVANAEEKYFLMFEGFRLMFEGLAQGQKQVIAMSPDESSREEASRWYRQLGCLSRIELLMWSRFSFSAITTGPSGDPVEFTEFASRTRDTGATKYNHYVPLDPAGFLVLGDLDYSPEKVNWLDTEPTGKWYEISRQKMHQKLFVKRTTSGLREVLSNQQCISVLFHIPGQRPVLELPPGPVDAKTAFKAGCLKSVLLLCSAAMSLLWQFCG